MGWIPLDDGVYLHVTDENATEVLVVGVVPADMQTARMAYAKALQAALPTMPESDTIKLN